ncbi:defensin [Drosophila rhopaloa]|uniref:Defensin n=1 Tax=Drosophila rhopaloa TaxID=1041015 RepID=A0A6P4EF81_DRORH|nr:defensin [Drosophila rhopaloa]
MKFIVFLAIALALVAVVVQAQPVPEEDHIPAEHPLVEQEAHSRQKRATCDLLSKWNWNHTACAAHCLTKGFKGGYCSDKAVCVCRN